MVQTTYVSKYTCKLCNVNSHLKYTHYIYGLCGHIWTMSATIYGYMQGCGNAGLLCKMITSIDSSSSCCVSIYYAMRIFWLLWYLVVRIPSCIRISSPVDVQLYRCWWWSAAQPSSPAGWVLHLLAGEALVQPGWPQRKGHYHHRQCWPYPGMTKQWLQLISAELFLSAIITISL